LKPGLTQQIDRDAASWTRDLVDVDAFQNEQMRLRQVWTLVGLTTELRHDGDWISRDLWGHSVFVQRFGDQLKGFENRCAHRFFPLRHGERGNGPIRCGFHGWQYDKEGVAIGIPMCKEFFGCTPKQMNARLNPVEIATCGTLIFGRFPGEHSTGSLADYLGEMDPILRFMTAGAVSPGRIDRDVAANWKLAYYITLEDYHIVAVHPSTFGANGPLRSDEYRYYRSGLHSAMLNGEDRAEESLKAMSAACAAGRYEAEGYRIFHIFPNLVVLHIRFFHRWYVLVMQYLATEIGRTTVRSWYFPADFATKSSAIRHLSDRTLDIPRAAAMRYGIRKIVGEDNAICERLQLVAHQASSLPLLATEEERIAWFDEAYARVMSSNA
jgi:phenylpropionate dioxygenase-like ring-hydroxylating dioxygenase large terminal subunit